MVNVRSVTAIASNASPAPNEVENKYHKRDYEKKVNEATGDMESKSTAPKEEEENGDN